MSVPEFFTYLLLALHFIGLAAIIGGFLVQVRRKSDFNFDPMLGGAITQVLTGVALAAIVQATDHDLSAAKIGVKLIIGLIVLASAIIAIVVQKRALAAGQSDRAALPWLHVMGAWAILNVLVAVFWH
jgi:hypothetical protein